MSKLFLVFFCLILGLLLFGCNEINNNLVTQAKKSPGVQAILTEYPNADLNVVFLSASDVNNMSEIITSQCGELIPLKEYYLVNINDKNSNTKITAYVDKNSQKIVCLRNDKNGVVEITNLVNLDNNFTNLDSNNSDTNNNSINLDLNNSDTNTNLVQDLNNQIVACSVTYSSWSDCNSGNQVRTILTKLPAGCIDRNSQALTQTCIAPLCKSSNWTSTVTPSTCPSSKHQTKTWTKSGDCNGGITHPAQEQIHCGSLESDDDSVICTENWDCNDWSICTNNSQDRTCTDLNQCGTVLIKPSESRICFPENTCYFGLAQFVANQCVSAANQWCSNFINGYSGITFISGEETTVYLFNYCAIKDVTGQGYLISFGINKTNCAIVSSNITSSASCPSN